MTGSAGKGRFDVCVIGGGPAGAIAAHVLAGAGARVALIVRDRPHSAFVAGETVPAETRLLLNGLGIDCLSADLHLPSAGTMVRWGSDVPYRHETILSPFGCGWHLDRPLFERQLIAAAARSGADLIEHCTRIASKMHRAGWEFEIASAGRQFGVFSDYAVDCTGRAARLAIEAGARRDVHDKLIAIWCIAEETGDRADTDQRIYLESGPNGWFYSARIPNRRRVLAYFTDGDLGEASRLRTSINYGDYVAEYFHLHTVVENLRYRIVAGPYRVSAASMKLVRAHGERWIAAGDAAQSFDPLSAQGIVTAIIGGNNAAVALIAARASDRCALEKFQADLDAAYAAYLTKRQTYYRAEQRWAERPFWQRRCCSLPPTAKAVILGRSNS